MVYSAFLLFLSLFFFTMQWGAITGPLSLIPSNFTSQLPVKGAPGVVDEWRRGGPYPKSGRYHWLGLPPLKRYLSSAIASNPRGVPLAWFTFAFLFFSIWNLGMLARTS